MNVSSLPIRDKAVATITTITKLIEVETRIDSKLDKLTIKMDSHFDEFITKWIHSLLS